MEIVTNSFKVASIYLCFRQVCIKLASFTRVLTIGIKNNLQVLLRTLFLLRGVEAWSSRFCSFLQNPFRFVFILAVCNSNTYNKNYLTINYKCESEIICSLRLYTLTTQPINISKLLTYQNKVWPWRS